MAGNNKFIRSYKLFKDILCKASVLVAHVKKKTEKYV